MKKNSCNVIVEEVEQARRGEFQARPEKENNSIPVLLLMDGRSGAKISDLRPEELLDSDSELNEGDCGYKDLEL